MTRNYYLCYPSAKWMTWLMRNNTHEIYLERPSILHRVSKYKSKLNAFNRNRMPPNGVSNRPNAKKEIEAAEVAKTCNSRSRSRNTLASRIEHLA